MKYFFNFSLFFVLCFGFAKFILFYLINNFLLLNLDIYHVVNIFYSKIIHSDKLVFIFRLKNYFLSCFHFFLFSISLFFYPGRKYFLFIFIILLKLFIFFKLFSFFHFFFSFPFFCAYVFVFLN